MKKLYFLCVITCALKFVQAQDSKPPIPIEVVGGHQSALMQMVVVRNIYKSKFQFFSLSNFETFYDNPAHPIYLNQNILFYNLPKGFNIGIGTNLNSFTGIRPIAAASFVKFTHNTSFLVQSIYELNKKGAFETYLAFDWTSKSDKNWKPYFKIAMLTSWYDQHNFSYHYWKLGANYKGFRFGPAVNFQHFGDDFSMIHNIGGFISINL